MTPTLRIGAVCVLALAAMLTGCHQQSFVPGRATSPDSVSVGYGQQPREKIGGAVQSLGENDMKGMRVRRVEELLAGRFPGVQVLPTQSGGFSIRIRGTASLPGHEPLYVIDGLAVEVSASRGIDWLDPSQIARIDVLRDPAETSIYGGRGANGVIVIKTR